MSGIEDLLCAPERMHIEGERAFESDGWFGLSCWLIRGETPSWFSDGWYAYRSDVPAGFMDGICAKPRQAVVLGPVVPAPNTGALWAREVQPTGWFVNADFVLGAEMAHPVGSWRWARAEGDSCGYLARLTRNEIVAVIAPLAPETD